MENLNLEDVLKKYKLPQDEHDEIESKIQKIWLADKQPVDNPTIAIILGPPGSGKTGLDGYSSKLFTDGNVVIINSDEIKTFQPHIDEIAQKYPQYYTQISGQESATWTKNLFERALNEKYNLIFELTGKNAEILNTIRTQMKGYKITVRGMAVSDLNCILSILERFEYQIITRGWGRLVTKDHFTKAYLGMPETIDLIEKSGLVDSVEIFMRGEQPSEPIKIYSTGEQTKYHTAKQAVYAGRQEDIRNASLNFKERLNNICDLIKVRNDTSCEEEKKIIEYARELYSKEQQNLKDHEM